jgi:hypothetical protein
MATLAVQESAASPFADVRPAGVGIRPTGRFPHRHPRQEGDLVLWDV